MKLLLVLILIASLGLVGFEMFTGFSDVKQRPTDIEFKHGMIIEEDLVTAGRKVTVSADAKGDVALADSDIVVNGP